MGNCSTCEGELQEDTLAESSNDNRVHPHILSQPPTKPTKVSANDADWKVGIASTPTGKNQDIYKYFCPICFMYYKLIFKSVCCSNYICLTCALAHIHSKYI